MRSMRQKTLPQTGQEEIKRAERTLGDDKRGLTVRGTHHASGLHESDFHDD